MRPPDYVDPSAQPSDEPKPQRPSHGQARAWLTPAKAGLPSGYRTAESGEPWTMFIEDGEQNPSFAGDFDVLLANARVRGVMQYFVWEPRAHTFEQFDPWDVPIGE